MAQAIEIRLWCDVCLDDGTHTEGATIPVPPMFGGRAFEVEACPEHAAELEAAVSRLRAFGRKPEAPAAPSATATGKRQRVDDTTAPGACPLCGEFRSSLSGLRAHLRDTHDKGLSDVGLAPRVFKCSECPPEGGWFARGQGFSAHRRSHHPKADPDGRAVAERVTAA